MKGEAIQNYFLFNGQCIPTTDFLDYESIGKPSIYEVIRIIDGVPLFLEEHLVRLRKSAYLLGYELHISDNEFSEQIALLIDLNKCIDHNIKIVVNNLDLPTPDLYIYFIESHYPDDELYRKGIYVVLYHGLRRNPNAKVINNSFKQEVNELLKSKGAYEALLVDEAGEIVEGSRSNIFFIKDKSVYTAPKEKVLEGITRQYICDICRKRGFPLIEESVKEKQLGEYDGLIMTGTSPKVLPISRVEDIWFASVQNPIVQSIKDAFNEIIRDYVLLHKK